MENFLSIENARVKARVSVSARVKARERVSVTARVTALAEQC